MSNSDDLFDLTIAPPAAGPAPLPPSDLREVFATLKAIQAGPRALQDRRRTGLGAARRLAGAARGGRSSPRAHGLSARATARWAQQIRETLSGPGQAQLLEYVHACRDWERALGAAIERGESDWEWDSSLYRGPCEIEAALAGSLNAFGIPVQVHAKVAEAKVRLFGPMVYDAIRLRWAHRDRSYLLRLAIELDGQYLHLYDEDEERDQERDQILAERGWYVARFSESIMRQELHGLVAERLAALVEQHRRAIVLARSDLPALQRNLG